MPNNNKATAVKADKFLLWLAPAAYVEMVFRTGVLELNDVSKLADGYDVPWVPLSALLDANNVFGDVCWTGLDTELIELSLVLVVGTTEVVHPPLLHTVAVMLTVFKVDVAVTEYSVFAVEFGYK